jgi:hypothetical protein
MSNAVQLLSMLEPAVRPGGLPGPTRAGVEPIESRSFESLLDEAKAKPTAGETAAPAKVAADPLRALSRVDLIDNAALLRIIGGA